MTDQMDMAPEPAREPAHESGPPSAPGDAPRWHFWLVGAIALLWNAFGAYDYLMTVLQGDAYLRTAGMTDAQIAYYHAMPAWMTGVWAVGVWSGVLGAVLLLLRKRWAFHVFALSFAAFIFSLIYAYFLSDGPKVLGQTAMIMHVVVFIGCAVFTWYAWTMMKKGVLR